MKRSVTAAIILLISAASYAMTGTASITPQEAAPNGNGVEVKVLYYPPAYGISAGKLELVIPDAFTSPPTFITSSQGVMKATIYRSGSTAEPVPQANILLSGNAVTITALDMATNDYMEIVYGDLATGYGVSTPMYPGEYVFKINESATGASYAALDSQPSMRVTNVKILKSANVTSVMAKNTVTYHINYQNLSNIHQANAVQVWDTIPQGMSIVGTYSAPLLTPLINGNFISFSAGNLSYLAAGDIYIMAECQPGIITYGTSKINSASLKYDYMYGGTYYESAEAAVNVSGANLQASASVAPANALLDQNVTVKLVVSNSGNLGATSVVPQSLPGYTGTGSVQYVYGPIPANASAISSTGAFTFTWIYKAAGTGTGYFTASARGSENTTSIESAQVQTNIFNIAQLPTATNTPVTPAATATNTPVVPPTATPEEKVKTDKNYFDPTKGEQVRIDYVIEKGGRSSIAIYNLNGELVREFYIFDLAPGTYTAWWNGTNDKSKKVGKGLYFVIVKQLSGQTTKKLYIVK